MSTKFQYICSTDAHIEHLPRMTQIDHWNFFSSPSSKNDQDESGTADN